MSANALKRSLLVSLVEALFLVTISSVQIVEVPLDLHNWTITSEGNFSTERTTAATTTATSSSRPKYSSAGEGGTRQHPCRRSCVEGEVMTCRYEFRVEHYLTMSKACYDCPFDTEDCARKDCIAADGVKRSVTVVNRQLPGPAIEVCLGDVIEVTVENLLFDQSTSIHWHGQHQRGSQHMDGVPQVTQCPIQPGTRFLYRFNASVPGTHFWHSHSGLQRGDGVFGSLIVKQPRDQFSDLYDRDLPEHVINIVDWTHVPGISKFVAHHHSDGDNKPVNILVNGRGRYQEFEEADRDILFTPLERFTVSRDLRYRFRLINSGSLNCPIELSFDNHTLVVIAGDGADLEPVEAQSLISYAGERFDFIVEMNQPVDNYWIRFRGLMDCDERFHSVYQLAILHYEGAETGDPAATASYDIKPIGLQINSMNTALNTSDSLTMAELRSSSTSRKDPRLKPTPDFKYHISYDFYPKDNTYYHLSPYYGFNQTEDSQRVYTPQLNHVSMKFPPFPLLSNPEESSRLETCNSSTIAKDCDSRYCECTHIVKIPKGAVVELIIVDEGFTYDANHPFHLHGYNFRVIGMDRIGVNVTKERIVELDEKEQLMRNLRDPPIKDTVTVPDGGYTIVRWHATNPGYWLFHCHIEFHMEIGMALVFKVGEDSDYPPTPKNFPRCHNFYPVDDAAAGETFSYKNYTEDNENEIDFNQIGNDYIHLSSHVASLHNSGTMVAGLLVYSKIWLAITVLLSNFQPASNL